MEIGIAIFGAGRWGVHLVRNFLNHPHSRVIAIVDPHAEHLQVIQKRLQLDKDIALVEDWIEALELPGISAVAIATPASTHYEIISAALKRGYHVFSEKPLTLEYSESIALCKLADKKKLQLFVDHTYLFNPVIETGKTIVNQGKLGELRYGYATRTHIEPVRSDVDALWDLAIHDICIFNSWLQETPVEVEANGTIWLPQKPPQSDLVMAKLIYPSHLEYLGSRWKAVDVVPEVITIKKAEPLAQVCHEFLNCILTNTTSKISSGWVGAKLVEILCALNNSLQQQGKAIRCDQAYSGFYN